MVELPRFCPHCGTEQQNIQTAFCTSCGKRKILDQPQGSQSPSIISTIDAPQRWEYKTIVALRGMEDRQQDAVWMYATAWNRWFENTKELPPPVDIIAKLNELGNQGWELVSVAPRSGLSGGYSSSIDPGSGVALDYAGFTNECAWVFKRPVS